MTSQMMLFSQMVPPAGRKTEFEQWYDSDHIPHRLAIDGFESAHRYWNDDAETRQHLAIYNISDPEALRTPEYVELKKNPSRETQHFLSTVDGFTRFTMEKISDTCEQDTVGAFVSVVAFEVPSEDVSAFEDWYLGEHVPLLMKAKDWLRVHRYRVLDSDGGPWNYFAFHELASKEVMDSPERTRARTGARRDALAQRSWFSQSGRWLYRRVRSHFAE